MAKKIGLEEAFEEIKSLNDDFEVLINDPEAFNSEYLRGQVELISSLVDHQELSQEEIRDDLWRRINKIAGNKPTFEQVLTVRTEYLEDFDARDIQLIVRSRNEEGYNDFEVSKVFTDIISEPSKDDIPVIIFEF